MFPPPRKIIGEASKSNPSAYPPWPGGLHVLVDALWGALKRVGRRVTDFTALAQDASERKTEGKETASATARAWGPGVVPVHDAE